MSKGTPAGRISGVECPECESIRTRCRSTGYSHENDRIRARRCEECGHRFLTAEIPLPGNVTWGGLVPYSREHDRRDNRLRFGWRSRPEWLRPVISLRFDVRVRFRPARERVA